MCVYFACCFAAFGSLMALLSNWNSRMERLPAPREHPNAFKRTCRPAATLKRFVAFAGLVENLEKLDIVSKIGSKQDDILRINEIALEGPLGK